MLAIGLGEDEKIVETTENNKNDENCSSTLKKIGLIQIDSMEIESYARVTERDYGR